MAQLLTFHSMLLGRTFADGTEGATFNKKPLYLSEALVATFHLIVTQFMSFPLPPFCWTTAKYQDLNLRPHH